MQAELHAPEQDAKEHDGYNGQEHEGVRGAYQLSEEFRIWQCVGQGKAAFEKGSQGDSAGRVLDRDMEGADHPGIWP